MAGKGDNSQIAAGETMLGFVERLESLDESIDELQQDKKEVYSEAKGSGFDKPTLQKLMQRRRTRRKNPDKVDEADHLLDLYERAIEQAEADRKHRKNRE